MMKRTHWIRTAGIVCVMVGLIGQVGCTSGTGSGPIGGDLSMDLASPVEVADVVFDPKVNVTGVALKGADGNTLVYCFDQRNAATTEGMVFLNVLDPRQPGGQLLARGGAAERQLLRWTQEHIDREFSREKQAELARKITVDGLTEKELQTLRLLRVTRYLQLRHPR